MRYGVLVNFVALALIGQAGVGQPVVSSAPPIVVLLEQIDRRNVYVHAPKEPLGRATVGLFLKDLPQSKVDALVRRGILTQSPVWVMDQGRIVLKGRLAGEAVWRENGNEEYGLLLAFPSEEDAEGAVASLKPSPDFKKAAPREKN